MSVNVVFRQDSGIVLLIRGASFSLPSVPRLLFDGWSYQDYMSVLASEDEIEELASELVDVAKVTQASAQP